jgi:nitrogen-specific signal transduction histidine kinase
MFGDDLLHGAGSDVPTVPEFPLSLEPHELLEILIGELRNPLSAVEGWAQIIAHDPSLEGITLEAAEAIPALTAYMRALLDEAARYLTARQG